jgi:hypothetical protein
MPAHRSEFLGEAGAFRLNEPLFPYHPDRKTGAEGGHVLPCQQDSSALRAFSTIVFITHMDKAIHGTRIASAGEVSPSFVEHGPSKRKQGEVDRWKEE